MKNKDFYKLLINRDKIQLKASTKWARDLQVDQIPLESYFGDIKTICKDNKLREFYFKLLHRIIVTKKELFLYGKEVNMLCRYCQMNDSIGGFMLTSLFTFLLICIRLCVQKATC